ncbi:MAG TPA: hypothetical protein VF897_06190 [Roseiflexaceae bacterium]
MRDVQTFEGSNVQTFKRSNVLTPNWSKWLLLALVFVLALPLLWFSLSLARPLHVEMGEWGDSTFLTGVNAAEENPTETYRWTGKRADLTIPNLGSRYRILRVRGHGWRPEGVPTPLVRVDVAGRPWGSFQTVRELRTYDILLPRDDSLTIRVGFDSQTYTGAGDRRVIGFAIDWIELAATDEPGGPFPWQIGGQALLLALALLLIGALALPRGWTTPSAVVLAAALIGANLWEPLWVSQALGGWLIVGSALLAATWLAAAHFSRLLAPWMSPRQAGVAWALLVAALALRLLGATHPLFDIHDLGFHKPWMESITHGQLYIYSTPSEFQNRQTFNPPIGYVLVMPLYLLLPSTRLVVQVGTALVDALGGALLLPLGRALGLTPRAALLALALYIALPINMTMLWWGFVTNDMAQTAAILLILLLLRFVHRPTWSAWAALTAASAVCLLMHIGALVLIVALLGASLLLGWLRLSPTSRWWAAGGALLALGLTALIYFSAAVQPAFAQVDESSSRGIMATLARGWAERDIRLGLVSQGWLRGFLPLPLALAPLGYLLLVRLQPRRSFERTLVLTLLAVCAVFFLVYMGLGLLVRYIYFATPLICLALGVLLGELWRRRGRVVAVAIVLLVVWGGVALWAGAVLMRLKPSLLPLTH